MQPLPVSSHLKSIKKRDVDVAGRSDLLLTWPQFLEFCAKAVDEYNRRECSALPKIVDPVTGLRRHMSPLECLLKHISEGWDIKAHQLEPAEIEVLFRPRELRTVRGGEVTLFGGKNTYWSRQLAHCHGQKVQVAYDIHDPERVQIWDAEDRFVCHADWRENSSQYMPQSALEHAADERAKRRAKIKLDNLAEIEEERRGIIEMAPVRHRPLTLIKPDREALAFEMASVAQEKPALKLLAPDRKTLAAEMEQAQDELRIPHDEKGKWNLWNQRDGAPERRRHPERAGAAVLRGLPQVCELAS